jgi:hypothetical protein
MAAQGVATIWPRSGVKNLRTMKCFWGCHHMFVRFRQTEHRLQVSIVENRRVGGKIHHEHVASLGSIETPLTVAPRIAFWSKLHQRLGRLANRVDPETRAKLLGAIHARIPMVTPDEQHALQLENAKADEKFWSRLHDMNAGTVEDHKGLAVVVARAISNGQAAMAKAAERRDAGRTRRERLQRGEDVPGGLGKPFTHEDAVRMLRDAGWTARDFRRMELITAIGGWGDEPFEEFLRELNKARERFETTLARAFLRKRGVRPERLG